MSLTHRITAVVQQRKILQRRYQKTKQEEEAMEWATPTSRKYFPPLKESK